MVDRDDMATVKSGETLLSVIDALQDLDGGSIEDVADYLNISPSTSYRYLNTLLKHRYIVKTGGEYQISLLFLTVGGYARGCIPSTQLIERTIDDITEITGERAQFITEEHGRRITAFMQSGENAVHAGKSIGFRGTLHSSAAGKAILAELPKKRVENIVNEWGMPAKTENTITDLETLMAELEEVKEQEYALNDEESTMGLRAVGVTVYGPQQELLGAVSLSGPKKRVKDERFKQEFPDLLQGRVNELELNIKHNL